MKKKQKITAHNNIIKCALPECGKEFVKRSHNSKYCCHEHMRIATNRRVLQRYYELKQRPPSGRVCAADGCGTILSTYNRSRYCGPCREKLGIP